MASSSIPKQLHCLALKLANEHSINANARLQLPSAELVPALVDNSFFHFVLASDNILAASVVASSLVHNSLPKALHHFDWFTKGKVPVLEAMEKDQKLFPSLNKVVFLDDDIVVQTDLSPLWDIDMNGKVNGAVETCRGEDKFVMSKRFKSYLNFSHPLIANSFDPNEWYQDNTTIEDAESAGVIHFNGRAKPWLDIAFPQLRPLWTKCSSEDAKGDSKFDPESGLCQLLGPQLIFGLLIVE
ncbi:UNVERIFIED_CONTAM: putative galacturonosyltransferase 12 [Sesamum calycinum]|uniref:Hexosyltransferase n=1 Tax=Sesamum calycinum TaxID=2727403 RepID=A0AAW2Q5G4_9LAMI